MTFKEKLERNIMLNDGYVFNESDLKEKLIRDSKFNKETCRVKPTDKYNKQDISMFLTKESLAFRVVDNVIIVYWHED